MNTPPIIKPPGPKKPMAWITGGLALSASTIVSYALAALCVLLFLAGCLVAGFGTAHGIKALQAAGIVMAIASMIWGTVFVWAAIALSVAQVGSLAMNAVALRQLNKSDTPAAPRSRALAIIGIVLSVFIMTLFGSVWVAFRAQQDARHHEIDSDYIVRVALAVTQYQSHGARQGAFPPALSAAEIQQVNPELFEMIIRMPSGTTRHRLIPYGAQEYDWPAYAAAVDDACDYRYVGADLTHSRALFSVAPRIIILYNKIPYDGGRTVAFANGTQRFVPNADLPSLFADASAARATLGLPPILLDAPPSPPR